MNTWIEHGGYWNKGVTNLDNVSDEKIQTPPSLARRRAPAPDWEDDHDADVKLSRDEGGVCYFNCLVCSEVSKGEGGHQVEGVPPFNLVGDVGLGEVAHAITVDGDEQFLAIRKGSRLRGEVAGQFDG